MSDERERNLRSLWGREGAYERLDERFDAISAALIEELDLADRRVLDAATGQLAGAPRPGSRRRSRWPRSSSCWAAWQD